MRIVHGHLALLATPDHRALAEVLEPLARAFAGRFHAFLPIQTYPIRTGAHGNTAFALVISLGWARRFDSELLTLIEARSLAWFGGDADARAWEPDGDAFLSPTLCEALLMARLLPQ
jgi:hypothetical protein